MDIRAEQLRVFEHVQRQRLVDRLLEHVSTAFAPLVAQIGPVHARRAIESALERAAVFRITIDADLCEFVNLAFVFGDAFPFAPEFGWARRLLDPASNATTEWKLEQVRAYALELLATRALAELDPS